MNSNEYEVSNNSNDYEYQYYFDEDSDEPIIYYNDEKNNATYIRICTYADEIKPKDEMYENNEIINPEKLIKSIYYTDNNKAIINLDFENYKKEISSEPRTIMLEGEESFKIEYYYYPKDVDIYVKLNNVLCSEVELKVNENNWTANASETVDLQYVLNNFYSQYGNSKDKYFSFCSEGKYCLVNSKGQFLVDFVSEKEIKYKDDLIIINKGGLDYLADYNLNILSDGYERMEFVKKSSKFSTNTSSDLQILNYNTDYIEVFNTNTVQGYTTERCGLIDKKGKLLTPIVYEKSNYIFLNASFRYVKVKNGNIITDLSGNKIDDRLFGDIERLGDTEYYKATVKNGEEYNCLMILNSYGKNILNDCCYIIEVDNSKIPLFYVIHEKLISKEKTSLPEAYMIDGKGKIRMQGIRIIDKDSEMPSIGFNRNNIVIDNVNAEFLRDETKENTIRIVSITDNEIILEEESLKVDENNETKKKRIVIRDGKLIGN